MLTLCCVGIVLCWRCVDVVLALWRRRVGVVLASSCVGVVFAVCFIGGRLDGSITEPQL